MTTHRRWIFVPILAALGLCLLAFTVQEKKTKEMRTSPTMVPWPPDTLILRHLTRNDFSIEVKWNRGVKGLDARQLVINVIRVADQDTIPRWSPPTPGPGPKAAYWNAPPGIKFAVK